MSEDIKTENTTETEKTGDDDDDDKTNKLPPPPITQPKQSPKLKKKSKRFTNANKLSKEQLTIAIKKKKECNAKAQNVVEKLLDPIEDEREFLDKLKVINQNHYDDVVVERAIVKICGYPLCGEPLKEIPKKQYQISTITNKIYDITERKNFCSSQCFKKSKYLREQLLTGPLWLRDKEDIPEFQLLTLNDNGDINDTK